VGCTSSVDAVVWSGCIWLCHIAWGSLHVCEQSHSALNEYRGSFCIACFSCSLQIWRHGECEGKCTAHSGPSCTAHSGPS
jgi:hypothetical protein